MSYGSILFFLLFFFSICGEAQANKGYIAFPKAQSQKSAEPEFKVSLVDRRPLIFTYTASYEEILLDVYISHVPYNILALWFPLRNVTTTFLQSLEDVMPLKKELRTTVVPNSNGLSLSCIHGNRY